MATTSRRTPATSLNPHVSRDTTPTATDPTAPPAITASVTADEVIAPGTVIELTFNAEVDAQSAQGAIRVQHRCEQVATNVTLCETRPPRHRATRRHRDRRTLARRFGATDREGREARRQLPASVLGHPRGGENSTGATDRAYRATLHRRPERRPTRSRPSRRAPVTSTSSRLLTERRAHPSSSRSMTRASASTSTPASPTSRNGAPRSLEGFTKRSFRKLQTRRTATRSRSSCGRVSSCPPRRIRSRPIVAPTNRPRARRK